MEEKSIEGLSFERGFYQALLRIQKLFSHRIIRNMFAGPNQLDQHSDFTEWPY